MGRFRVCVNETVDSNIDASRQGGEELYVASLVWGTTAGNMKYCICSSVAWTSLMPSSLAVSAPEDGTQTICASAAAAQQACQTSGEREAGQTPNPGIWQKAGFGFR